MLTVKYAVTRLKQAGIISNEEVLRRWLREGKIEGAYIENKKHGWKIPEDSIITISTNHENKSSNKEYDKEYDKGYQDGYAVAQAERKSKMRQLVVKGGYDEQFGSVAKF